MSEVIGLLFVSAVCGYATVCIGWRIYLTTVADRAFRRDGLDAALIRIRSAKGRKPRWLL